MPKVSIGTTPPEVTLIREIRAGMARNGYNSKELAELCAMPQSTMSERMNHPETVRLGELIRMAKAVNVEIKICAKEDKRNV